AFSGLMGVAPSPDGENVIFGSPQALPLTTLVPPEDSFGNGSWRYSSAREGDGWSVDEFGIMDGFAYGSAPTRDGRRFLTTTTTGLVPDDQDGDGLTQSLDL